MAALDSLFDSWKIHYMEFVDEFRKSKDYKLIMLPPVALLDIKLKSLLASIVATLCHENSVPIPAWANEDYFIKEPWFISEMESLKASAILESPIYFRKNNIFVLENFLRRNNLKEFPFKNARHITLREQKEAKAAIEKKLGKKRSKKTKNRLSNIN